MVIIAAIDSIVSDVRSFYRVLAIASKIASYPFFALYTLHKLQVEILMYYIKMILKPAVCSIDLKSVITSSQCPWGLVLSVRGVFPSCFENHFIIFFFSVVLCRKGNEV